MQVDNSLSPELQKKTLTVISTKVIELIANRTVPYAQIRNMAEFVTDGLPEVENTDQYILFLEDVLTEFPFLSNEVKILKGEIGVLKEKNVINKLQSYIKNLTPN